MVSVDVSQHWNNPHLLSESIVALRPQRPHGLLGTVDPGWPLDFHTAPELRSPHLVVAWVVLFFLLLFLSGALRPQNPYGLLVNELWGSYCFLSWVFLVRSVCLMSSDAKDPKGKVLLLLLLLLKCCFTSTETVGLLGTGAQDVHLDFHTPPELWSSWLSVALRPQKP